MNRHTNGSYKKLNKPAALLCAALLGAALLCSGCGAKSAAAPSAAGSESAGAAQQTAGAAAQSVPGGAVVSGSASENTDPHTRTVYAMDTVMDLTIYGGDDSILEEAEELILSLEKRLSVTDPESEMYALNRAGTLQVGEETASLLRTALEICESSDGALDITIRPIMKAWGFTEDAQHVPDPALIEELLKKVDYRKVTVGADNTVTMEEGVEADLGCITKGYCSDRVLQLFAERGIKSAIVNLGGNVQTLGAKVNGSLWRIALIDPFGNGYAGMVTVENKAVITSGGYERYFVEDGVTYHHIMDPKTGSTARTGLSSATVVTDRGVRGDGLSTALFVLGAEGAADLWRARGDFEMVLITDGGDVLITPGLKDSFTLLDSYMGKEVQIIE